jgi:hypothetical protein
VSSKWFDWWGGWSYGYRHIVDTAPILVLMLIPVVDRIFMRRGLLVCFVLCLVWSVGAQVLGAFAYDIDGWNARTAQVVVMPHDSLPRAIVDDEVVNRLVATQGAKVVGEVLLDVDHPANRDRLWSLSDSQILYYLIHFKEARHARKGMMRAYGGG